MLQPDRKRTFWSRALAVTLVFFLLLASARGLVPGICLTLREAGQPSEVESGPCTARISGLRSCCAGRAKSPTPASREDTPRAPSRHCAFCNLAKACTDFSPYFWRDLAATPISQDIPAPRIQHARSFAPYPTGPSRAPPAFPA